MGLRHTSFLSLCLSYVYRVFTQMRAERACTVPFPVLFYKYGERVRRQCKYAREAAEVLEQMMGASQQQGEEKSEKPKEQA